MNRRHRLAQYAARASVELFTVLYFKNRHLDETAHIIRVLRQGIVVLVDKCAHARPAPAGARCARAYRIVAISLPFSRCALTLQVRL